MTEKKKEQSFWGKIFGGKGGCCSVQFEEIDEKREQKPADAAANDGSLEKEGGGGKDIRKS